MAKCTVRHSLLRACLPLVLLAMIWVPAQSAPRVALVIGNASYEHAAALANPLNDAADVGAALSRLGFAVTTLENASYSELRRGLLEFTLAASASEVAVVFYAGHGIEVDQRNFLVPVDARLASDQSVEFETVPLDLVQQAVKRALGLRLVIVDACRDNPFASSMQRAGATRSIGRGLARVEPSGDTLVAYAAKEGTVAADGEGRNSPYSAALLANLEEPGLEVGLMFRRVRDAVLAATGGSQEPFVYGSLSSRGVYLAKAPAVEVSPAVAAGESAALRAAAEREFWVSVSNSTDPADLKAYLEQYSGGTYEVLARNRLKRLLAAPQAAGAAEAVDTAAPASEAVSASARLGAEQLATERGFWESVKNSTDPEEFRAYLERYPNGTFVPLAQNRLKRLGVAAAETEAPVDESAARAYEAAERLHVAEGYEVVVEQFPGSTYAELARAQVRKLRDGLPSDPESGAATVAVVAPGDAVVVAPPAVVDAPEEVSAEPDPSGLPGGPEAVELALELDRSERRLVQVGLSSLGFDPGPADGLIGRRTRGAIGRLQSSRGLSATGFLDAELAKELLLAADAVTKLDDAAFALARSSGSSESYASYLGAYPRGRHASEARDLFAAVEASERLGPGAEFRDCSVCPAMVVVPAGSFMMGSPAGTEDPLHRMEISKPFAVGKHEVTFAEWDACVSAGGCGYRPGDRGWGRGTRPVINLSWDDAQSYVAWLSGETGAGYRLLSEAEWEYAARAGTTTRYWWGNEIGRNRANCDGCGSRWDDRETAPVGSFSSNEFGLHDMHGNVWEWVEDCWHNSYSGAPTDESAWTTGGDCSRRVLRGGSWFNSPRYLRSANRLRDTTRFRRSFNGFRVARTLTP